MLESFGLRSELCERLRSGPAGPYLDSFAEYLAHSGYRPQHGRYLHAVGHFASWARDDGLRIAALDELSLERFQQHLSSCDCVRPTGDRRAGRFGSRLFLKFLRGCGVVPEQDDHAPRLPPLVRDFGCWMIQHRCISESTLRKYVAHVVILLNELGENTSCFNAQSLRSFVLEYATTHSIATTKNGVKAIRMFLRFLVAEGKCTAGLEHSIPTFANWRLSTLPRYLPAEDLERVLDACDDSTEVGARDRAILLLLCRLGLRSGDILGLEMSDIDWIEATLVVSGKSCRQSQLPLTQEVGEALLTYFRYRPDVETGKVFIRVLAPIRPLKGPSSVGGIVRSALRRAGVKAPSEGAHMLRHSTATEMLRQGVPLQDIQAVLRHRSIETTTLYAKVDVRLLKQIAQPWPEVSSC